jgi:hypothetical protein
MQGNKWTKFSLYNWYRVVFDEVKEVIPAARQWSCKTDQNIDSFNKQRTRMMLLTTKKKRDRWIIGIHWELVIFRLRLGKIRHSSVWQMMRLVKLENRPCCESLSILGNTIGWHTNAQRIVDIYSSWNVTLQSKISMSHDGQFSASVRDTEGLQHLPYYWHSRYNAVPYCGESESTGSSK